MLHDVGYRDRPPAWPAVVLTWADLTSSPGGELCSVSHRLADMLRAIPRTPACIKTCEHMAWIARC